MRAAARNCAACACRPVLEMRLTWLSWIIILHTSHVNTATGMSQENRTARLTILVDPEKKAVFEALCAREDLTPSQVVRRLIRAYIEEKLGRPWKPGAARAPAAAKKGARSVRGKTGI